MNTENCGLRLDDEHSGPGQPERLTYTVTQAGHLLGICRNSAYQLAAAGQIPTVRLGRRVLVPKAALDRLLETTALQITENTDGRK